MLSSLRERVLLFADHDILDWVEDISANIWGVFITVLVECLETSSIIRCDVISTETRSQGGTYHGSLPLLNSQQCLAYLTARKLTNVGAGHFRF